MLMPAPDAPANGKSSRDIFPYSPPPDTMPMLTLFIGMMFVPFGIAIGSPTMISASVSVRIFPNALSIIFSIGCSLHSSGRFFMKTPCEYGF